MNKYQEQLNQIIKEYYQLGDIIHDLYKYADYPDNIKCDLLQELVDKATPKKPYKSYYCPNCKKDFLKSLNGYEDYCGGCGQKLDWSEND